MNALRFSLLAITLLPLTLLAQWQRQYPLEKLEQVLDITLHDDGYGFAVGSHDLILKLDPGTKTWDLLLSWNQDWKLEAVDYLPSTTGLVAAAGGQGLIVTDNGGVNWMEVPGAPAGIKAIKMLSATDIVVCAAEGVFRWKDKNWEDLSPVTSGIKGAFILDDQHIWCFTTGGSAILYYTSDGGQTWYQNTDIPGPDVVIFYDDQYGIASDGRMIFMTLDGGQHWTLRSNNAINNTSADIAFGSSPNVLIAATLNNNPGISQDSGLTWTPKLTGLINTRSYSVAATSDQDFWLGDDISTIGHSTDGGSTWIESSGPPRTIVQDAHFLSRTYGIAVGTKGSVYRTMDGGINWEDISTGENRNYLSIHGLNANDLWIGASLKILHSDDMGETWTEKASFLGGNINDILAVSSTRILACSSSGIIYRSTDSGTKWDTVYNANNQLRSLAMIDGQRYMATGFDGVILRSEDQGDTWNSVTIPEPALQYEQSYFLGNDGWLVSSSFKKTMWHTSNAGDSWDPIDLPVDRFWDGVFFMTPDTGVAVCHNTSEGRAYITYNGGMTWQAGYIVPFALTGIAGIPNPNGTAWIFGFGSDIETLPYCNALPMISGFAGEIFPCEKDTVTYTVASQDVEQFVWSFPPGWTIVGNANNDTIQVIAGKNAGSISVSASNVCGVSGQLSYTASPSPLPAIGDFQGDLIPCLGEDVLYSVTAMEADAYHWIFPAGWTILGDSTSATVQATAGSSGAIQVYATNDCGESTVLNYTVTPFMHDPIEINVNGDNLSVPDEGAQYQWYLNGSAISGATNAMYEITESGLYVVVVYFPQAGCQYGSLPVMVIYSAYHDAVGKEKLSVFPSPANSWIQVTGMNVGDPYVISNAIGEVVLRGQWDENPIQISNLPHGVYWVRSEVGKAYHFGRFVVGQ